MKKNITKKSIAVYVYPRDYGLMNRLVAKALAEYEQQEINKKTN
jgi:hypothetical protein